jgi:hypothetical protein
MGTREGRVICYSGGISPITGLNAQAQNMPRTYRLAQNFPNPFNPETTFYFTLPRFARVSLSIYNVLGQIVAKPLRNDLLGAGDHQVLFNAEKLPSGMYIYRLESDLGILQRKMLLLK